MAAPKKHPAWWLLRGAGGYIAASLLSFGHGTAINAATTAAEQAPASQAQVLIAQPPKPIADFELVDQEGHPFKLSALRNKPALIFFGFTHCPDVCPATLVKLRLLTDSQPVPDLEVVMISVDGDRDSPEAMKAYLAKVSPRFIGLTGDPRIVRGIAEQFPAVFFKGFPERPGGEYAVAHTSQVYLVDQQGRLRATFDDAPVTTMEQVTRDLTK
jgi:protein SCO1